MQLSYSTDRFLLTAYRGEDVADFFEIVKNNRKRLVDSFPITVQRCMTKSYTRLYINEMITQWTSGIKYGFGIKLKEEGQLIGHIGIKNIDQRVPKCELGYFIDREYQGQGFVKEAISQVQSICFSELKMHKIFLRIISGNEASIGVAKKCGFTKEATLKKDFRTYGGDLVDVEYFSIFAD